MLQLFDGPPLYNLRNCISKQVAKSFAYAYNGKMSTIFDTRRENLRRLIAQWGGPTSLAAKLGHASGSYLAQLAGPHPTRDVSERVAREIEQQLEIPAGWMDHRHAGPPGRPSTGLLIDVVAAVRDQMDAAGVSARRGTLEDIATLVYEHAVERGEIDLDLVRRLVAIAKGRA